MEEPDAINGMHGAVNEKHYVQLGNIQSNYQNAW